MLRVERDDAQPVRPLGCGRRRLELDAHLAEDAHGAVAERLEQPAGGGVGLEDAVLDPACAARGPRPPRARSRSASRSRARARRGGRTPRRARARLARAPRRSRRCGRRRGRRARPARGRAPTTRPPDRPARTRVSPYSDDSSATTTSVTAAASAATAGVRTARSMSAARYAIAWRSICSGHTFRGATHRERAGSSGRCARARRGGSHRRVRLGTRWPGGRGRRAGRLRVGEPDRPARRESGAEPLARRSARRPARGRRARDARPRHGRPANRARDAHRLGVGARGERSRPLGFRSCVPRSMPWTRTTAQRSIASARPSSPGGSTPYERPSGPAACASRAPAVILDAAR